MMRRSFTIIDDFLPEPDAVRADALKLNYPWIMKGTNFPGRNSAESYSIPGVMEQLSYIAGEHLMPASNTTHEHFRITLAEDVGNAGVHNDHNKWSAILYLSPGHSIESGTLFFQHKKTGMERAPLFDREAQAHGYRTGKEMCERVFWSQSLVEDAWTQTFQIPMRYNRLVFFNASYWHNAGQAFGDSLENGRLIYTLFYDPAGQPHGGL